MIYYIVCTQEANYYDSASQLSVNLNWNEMISIK